jgi:hypothetical protein
MQKTGAIKEKGVGLREAGMFGLPASDWEVAWQGWAVRGEGDEVVARHRDYSFGRARHLASPVLETHPKHVQKGWAQFMGGRMIFYLGICPINHRPRSESAGSEEE